MTDLNVNPDLDLSMETLMRACKGDVSQLPSFMVHDNDAWPWKGARPDNKNRVHMRRSVFLRTVCAALPVRPGIWRGQTVQEFHLDLKPHHIGGSEETQSDKARTARLVVKMDTGGRLPEEQDYGAAVQPLRRPRPTDTDIAEARASNGFRSLRTTGLVAPGSE